MSGPSPRSRLTIGRTMVVIAHVAAALAATRAIDPERCDVSAVASLLVVLPLTSALLVLDHIDATPARRARWWKASEYAFVLVGLAVSWGSFLAAVWVLRIVRLLS